MSEAKRGGPQVALFVREAWKNIRSAPILMLVAVLTISASLVLVGLFGFVMVNAGQLLDAIEEDLRVTLYLDDDVSDETVDQLVRTIADREEVASVTVLSREEDRKRNLELLGEGPEALLEGLDDEAIPASACIEVQLEPRQRHKDAFVELPKWLTSLEGADGVQELHFGADKLRVIFAIIDLIRITGLLISAILLAAAVFFTVSTIKLAVYSRQDEIEILRLVGATDGFIRAPFYIEGAVAGLLGSVTALAIVMVIHTRLRSYVDEQVLINVDLHLMPPGMVIWLLVGGIGLGLLGSAFSVQRYLRV